MATEDKLSKKELGGDVGAGVAGALLGALCRPSSRGKQGYR